MASYTKQMVELAAAWLGANKDVTSPFLDLPAGVLRDYDVLANRVADLRRQVAAAGSSAEALDEADQVIKQMRKLDADITSSRNKLTALINMAPEPGKVKSLAEHARQADLGRWCLAWARHGYNTFELSPDFTAAMLLTDPEALDISTVKLPFDGFLILLPSGFAEGVEGLSYTRVHVWLMPARDAQMLDALTKIEGALEGHSVEEQKDLLNKLRAHKEARPSILGPTLWPPFICIHATDGVHAFTTVVEMADLSWEAIESLQDHGEVGERRQTSTADQRAQRTIHQIVFGLLVYTNAVEGAIVRREIARKPKKRTQEQIVEPAPSYWEVGRTVRIDPRLVQAAREGSRENALRIQHRFVVRGHYRNQAHGPQRSLRTMRWIEPFWKGPEEGARIVHTYRPSDVSEDRK